MHALLSYKRQTLSTTYLWRNLRWWDSLLVVWPGRRRVYPIVISIGLPVQMDSLPCTKCRPILTFVVKRLIAWFLWQEYEKEHEKVQTHRGSYDREEKGRGALRMQTHAYAESVVCKDLNLYHFSLRVGCAYNLGVCKVPCQQASLPSAVTRTRRPQRATAGWTGPIYRPRRIQDSSQRPPLLRGTRRLLPLIIHSKIPGFSDCHSLVSCATGGAVLPARKAEGGQQIARHTLRAAIVVENLKFCTRQSVPRAREVEYHLKPRDGPEHVRGPTPIRGIFRPSAFSHSQGGSAACTLLRI